MIILSFWKDLLFDQLQVTPFVLTPVFLCLFSQKKNCYGSHNIIQNITKKIVAYYRHSTKKYHLLQQSRAFKAPLQLILEEAGIILELVSPKFLIPFFSSWFSRSSTLTVRHIAISDAAGVLASSFFAIGFPNFLTNFWICPNCRH